MSGIRYDRWPAVFEQAASSAGLNLSTSIYDGSSLSAITGKPSSTPYSTGDPTLCTTEDCLFTLLGLSQSERTPMVIITSDNATVLNPGWRYAVLNASTEGDTRK